MYFEWLLHKKTTAFPISSLSPNSQRGISSTSSCFSSSESHLFIEVFIIPGDMALTLMLLGPSSFAKAFVNELTPPLDAEYITSQDAPTFPHIEDILTIFPVLFCNICLTTQLQQLNTPFKLVPIILSQSSSIVSINNPTFDIPALFTRISTFPNSLIILSIATFVSLKLLTSHLEILAYPPIFSISSLVFKAPSSSVL